MVDSGWAEACTVSSGGQARDRAKVRAVALDELDLACLLLPELDVSFRASRDEEVALSPLDMRHGVLMHKTALVHGAARQVV